MSRWLSIFIVAWGVAACDRQLDLGQRALDAGTPPPDTIADPVVPPTPIADLEISADETGSLVGGLGCVQLTAVTIPSSSSATAPNLDVTPLSQWRVVRGPGVWPAGPGFLCITDSAPVQVVATYGLVRGSYEFPAGVGPRRVAAIPSVFMVRPGARLRARVVGQDEQGMAIRDVTLASKFTTSLSTVISVEGPERDVDGREAGMMLRAVSAGSAGVQVSLGQVRSSIQVTVANEVPTRVTLALSPMVQELAVGDAPAYFSITGTWTDGSTVDLSGSADWSVRARPDKAAPFWSQGGPYPHEGAVVCRTPGKYLVEARVLDRVLTATLVCAAAIDPPVVDLEIAVEPSSRDTLRVGERLELSAFTRTAAQTIDADVTAEATWTTEPPGLLLLGKPIHSATRDVWVVNVYGTRPGAAFVIVRARGFTRTLQLSVLP